MNCAQQPPQHTAETAQESSGEFRRELGLLSSTMMVIGSMVGSGIFIVSADIARTVGSPALLLLVWLLTGLVTVCAALSYGELAGMMPQAGGQYVYLREAYSPLVGFLYGWTLFTVIQTGTIAAVAVAFAKFTAVVFPVVSTSNVLVSIGTFGISGGQLFAMASIVVLTLLNVRGVQSGKRVQDVVTLAKVAALAALVLLGLTVGWNHDVVATNFTGFWQGLSGGVQVSADGTQRSHLTGVALWAAVGTAMVGSLFSSDAWNNITFAAAEVKQPKRTIPLALALGTLTVTSIYLLANVVYLVTLPLEGSVSAGASVMDRGIQFATNDRVGVAAVEAIVGEANASVAALSMAVLIMISTFGCNNGVILAGARVYYAMSRDGLFFRQAGLLNRRGVPAWSLVAQCVWACALCLSGTYGDLLDYVVFAVLVFYILTIGGIIVLRFKRPEAERPIKAFGYPIVPVLYMVVASAICVDLLVLKPSFTYPGLLIVLTGIPVYWLWKRKIGTN
jgi:APA family basic amino acid/polyamine antiporter